MRPVATAAIALGLLLPGAHAVAQTPTEPPPASPPADPPPPDPAKSPPEGTPGEGGAQPPAADPPPPADAAAPSEPKTGAGEGAASAPKDPVAPGRDAEAKPEAKPEEDQPSAHQGSFSFGSYGRMIAATDARGGPGRDADIVAHGSRLDEGNYVELELRRDDHWKVTGAKTQLVATLAFAHPVFHYNGEFDAKLAVRNLYLEERDLGADGLSVWAGSRMLRGDDIYLLDFWPLDDLNTVGAGVGYGHAFEGTPSSISLKVHGGLSRPETPFYHQSVERPAPLDQFGAANVVILDRQRFIGNVRAEYAHRVGKGAGVKGVLYGETHQLPSGQRETETPRDFESLPSDDGWVVGGQLGAWSGERDTHINLFVRYATGLAAYGQFATPSPLAADDTTTGAGELVVAAGGNVEFGPVGILLGTYVRSFRNANPGLDYQDVDEGIVALRPSVFFGELAGLSLEGSYQMAQRGVVAPDPEDPTLPPSGPKTATVWRFGVMPFLSPAGRGSFSRPQIRVIYAAALRDEVARQFYPQDDAFSLREVEHFLGAGAEWWFDSTTYDR